MPDWGALVSGQDAAEFGDYVRFVAPEQENTVLEMDGATGQPDELAEIEVDRRREHCNVGRVPRPGTGARVGQKVVEIDSVYVDATGEERRAGRGGQPSNRGSGERQWQVDNVLLSRRVVRRVRRNPEVAAVRVRRTVGRRGIA